MPWQVLCVRLRKECILESCDLPLTRRKLCKIQMCGLAVNIHLKLLGKAVLLFPIYLRSFY